MPKIEILWKCLKCGYTELRSSMVVSNANKDVVAELRRCPKCFGSWMKCKKKRQMETITIEEFKNLESYVSLDKEQVYGDFAIPFGVHKSQCKNIKLGNSVFFLRVEPGLEAKVASLNLTVIEAIVVERKE